MELGSRDTVWQDGFECPGVGEQGERPPPPLSLSGEAPAVAVAAAA